MNPSADPIGPFRGRLLGLAYRMLGSRADAEDVLQDAYLRLQRARGIENIEAFATTTVTRLCLDRLKRARAAREVYVGAWLPEPVLDTDRLSPETATELADDLSFALLLALERLSPLERAAFLLHDVFSLPFGEIAAVLDRSDTACRQLASRARKALSEKAPPRRPAVPDDDRVFEVFMAALANGDVAELTRVLAQDAVLLTDAGGLRPSALNPIRGADKIVRLLVAGRRMARPSGCAYAVQRINGMPGVIGFLNGVPQQTLSTTILDGRIVAIYFVNNAGKLTHLARCSA